MYLDKKHHVYYLKNGADVFYVGKTSDLKDRKSRHFSGQTSASLKICNSTELVIDESFESDDEAISYEMCLSVFFKSVGHNLLNKFFGRFPIEKGTKIGNAKGKYVSPETYRKISIAKKQNLANKPYLKEMLQENNEKRKKKVFRSDGHIYIGTEVCMRDLKISGKKMKELMAGAKEHKGFKISFSEFI